MTPDLNVPPAILIALSDTDSHYRAVFAAAIQSEKDLSLLAGSLSAEDAFAAVERELPNILLLSIDDNPLAIIAVLDRLRSAKGNTKIILLVRLENQDFFVQAVRAGCRGILHKESPMDLVLKCVRKVNEGELWLDRATTAQVLRQITEEHPTPRPKERDSKNSPLSPREREVVGLVVQGFKNKELAEKLAISEQTVKNHLHNIFDKLGVSDRLELTLYAIHNRLLDSTD